MKKTIVVLSLILGSLVGYSQDTTNDNISDKKEKTLGVSYKTNGLWDNWFINVGGGGAMYFGNGQEKEADLSERLMWGATASVGKWITPLFGARLTAQGGKKNVFSKDGVRGNTKHHMVSGHYVSLHADAMLNVSNLFSGYKENRVYNFIPYIGLGIATDNKKIKNKTAVAAAGFLNTFRINDKFNITLDVSGQAVQSKFDRAHNPKTINGKKVYKNQDWDGIGSAMLGITYNIGKKRNFDIAGEIANTDTEECALCEALVDDLNNQIDNLIAENETLKANAQVTTPETTIPSNVVLKNVPNAIHFQINKSTIDPSQELTIFGVADFLKNNPDTAVNIVGYADKQTGTSSINAALSRRRAEAVENKLVNEYGISKDRIYTDSKGSQVQPYPVNNWNRVVVITVTDNQ